MASVITLTFNPFQENTYIIYDDTRECIIIDPGMYLPAEREAFAQALRSEELKPVRLLNTHAHLDHVFGNLFVKRETGLLPELNRNDLPILEALPQISAQYGIPNVEPSPLPEQFLEAGDEIRFGNTRARVIFVPGHSPGSVCFYFEEEGLLVAGDVLFYESIGRTDLPGGDHGTLLNSIRSQLMTLPDEVVVLPGHGPRTTIGHERVHNPFF